MQSITDRRRFVAEWGPYRVVLDNRGDRCLVEITHAGDDRAARIAAMPRLPSRTAREAIEWAAEQLKALGCAALIDGRVHSLADFLVFV